MERKKKRKKERKKERKSKHLIKSILIYTVVYCDPLSKPEFGYYHPASCTTTKQACKSTSSSTCIYYCNNGFKRQGADSDFRRICQSNGRWTFSDAKCKG
jgi:hypothetical protein